MSAWRRHSSSPLGSPFRRPKPTGLCMSTTYLSGMGVPAVQVVHASGLTRRKTTQTKWVLHTCYRIWHFLTLHLAVSYTHDKRVQHAWMIIAGMQQLGGVSGVRVELRFASELPRGGHGAFMLRRGVPIPRWLWWSQFAEELEPLLAQLREWVLCLPCHLIMMILIRETSFLMIKWSGRY